MALSDEATTGGGGGGGGGEEEGEGGREVENEPHTVCGREEKTFAFDEKQDPCFKGDFYRHTVPLLRLSSPCPHVGVCSEKKRCQKALFYYYFYYY